MDSITQPEPSVNSEITAVIRDWQRRRNVGVRSIASAKRNAKFIVNEVASGGWATDFVLDMCRLAGKPASEAEVKAVATAMAEVAQ